MVELHAAQICGLGHLHVPGGGHARAHAQHGADAVGAGGGLGDRDDQVRQLDQLHQNLADVIHQRHDLALAERARVDPHRAGVQQRDQRGVDGDVGQRVHQRTDLAGQALQAGQSRVLAVELGDFVVLAAEGAQHAGTAQVLAGQQQHAVQLGLGLFVQRHGDQHDAEHDHRQHRYGHREHQRAAHVDGEGHDHRAEHDEGRAQEQSQTEVHARLHLIDVAGHAGDERGGADAVEVGKAQLLDVGKHRVAQLRGQAHGGLRGEVLGGHAAGQADQAQQHQNRAHAQDVARVAAGDALIDDGGDDEGNDQLKAGLQQLEQRAEDALLPVIPQIRKYLFHKRLPFPAELTSLSCIF